MGFFRQFVEFDPLVGEVPAVPFKQLPSIASRARKLLAQRTRDEIVSAAENADFFIGEYFVAAKDSYVRNLLEHGGWELGYLGPDARNEVGIRDLLDNWPTEAADRAPDLPSSDNTSDLDALRACIGSYSLIDATDFPNGHEFEYFAVMSLWKVGDVISAMKWTSDPEVARERAQEVFAPMPSGFFPNVIAPVNDALAQSRSNTQAFVDIMVAISHLYKSYGLSDEMMRLTFAAPHAIDAMEAVCYAEQLLAAEVHSAEKAKMQQELQSVVQSAHGLAETKAKQKISVAASKAAIKRHAENYAMKEQVFKWCASHLHEFASTDAAAGAVAGKLVPIAFRTASSWIAEFRKRERSARRL